MRFRKLFQMIGFVAVAVCASRGFAFETCEVEKSNDPKLSGALRAVTFPDGRKIRVLGEKHGDRGLPPDLSDLLQSYKSKGNSQEFNEKLRDLIRGTEASADQQEKNLVFLRRLLTTEKEIEFVALEGDPEVLKRNEKFFERLRRDLSQAASTHHVPAYDRRAALLLSMGAPTFLKSTEPGLFKNRRVIGVEAQEMVEREEKLTLATAVAHYELLKLAKGDEALQAEFHSERTKLNNTSLTQPESVDYDKWLNDLKSRWPRQYHAAVEKWLSTEFANFKSYSDRDAAVVSNLVNQRRSGILFVGAYHLSSLTAKLKMKCRAEAALETLSPGPRSLITNRASVR